MVSAGNMVQVFGGGKLKHYPDLWESTSEWCKTQGGGMQGAWGLLWHGLGVDHLTGCPISGGSKSEAWLRRGAVGSPHAHL